jgi:predicted ArsR family transcriptional regulator
MEPKRNRIDWDVVECEYRMGRMTITALAEAYGVSRAAIRKHMMTRGIIQDRSDEVRAAVQSRLHAEGIEVAGDEGAKIVREHRSAGSLLRQVAVGLLSSVKSAIDSSDSNNDLEKLSDIGNKAGAMLERAIKIERAAYGLVEREQKSINLDDINVCFIPRKSLDEESEQDDE